MDDSKELLDFTKEFGGSIESFMIHTKNLSLDNRNDKQAYYHASYIHNVIGDYDELIFSDIINQNTYWKSSLTDYLYSVETLESGGVLFKHPDLSDDENKAFNEEHQNAFQIHHATTIHLAKEIVQESTSEATRKRLRKMHKEFAEQVLGMQNPQLGPLYGYHGNLPFGITWGKTDVTKARCDEDTRRAQYYKVIEDFWKDFGESGLSRGLWEVEHYNSWASPFDQISIQYFFSENHNYSLTPIALYYFENIYNQWDEAELNLEDYL